MKNKRYTRFCGIDIAKNKHVACILNRDGEFIVRSQSFYNSAEGYQRILDRLKQACPWGRPLIGMEATGYYWYALRDFLVARGYEVAVMNPIQTHQQAKKGIRKSKTDKIDARHIATLIKNGEHRPALIPGNFAMTCRQLTRLRYRTVGNISRLKLLVWSRLGPVWPEYETLFGNSFCKTSRRLLLTAPTPDDVLAMDRDELAELVYKTSRGRYRPALADRIRESAAHTIGTRRGIEGARIGIRSLITQIEALMPLRRQLEADIEPLADRLPAYYFTLPGISRFTAVSLFGETDPITAFASGSKLVAFAGLDTNVFQTGQCTGEKLRRKITKRGSPFLRHTLWTMAHHACYQEGDLKDYWLRRKRQGLHHLAAVTATALKLCHVVWRILTDERDYLPQQAAGKD
ncbi:IS110 family transposase [candidate division GN15 bacterium]|nr:IS110 family transposase [candidate division GN15 bacterium]